MWDNRGDRNRLGDQQSLRNSLQAQGSLDHQAQILVRVF